MRHTIEAEPKSRKQKRSDMNNEIENKPNPTGSVNPTDTKTSDSPADQGQGNPPQDISKKNPSQGRDSQHGGQEKPEDEKRRAS
jgi:hypothetical protein